MKRREVVYVPEVEPSDYWEKRVILVETPRDGLYWMPDGNIYWVDPTGFYRLEVKEF